MAFWEEFRAVARKGWAVLGGAMVTAVGLIANAIHSHWPWALWWLPLLLGVILAEALVIAERRGERDALQRRVNAVRDCLALDAIKIRHERLANGPPSLHRIEMRLVFHNTADLPILWSISDVQVGDTPVQKYVGLGTGTIAPGKTVYYSITADVEDPEGRQVPPKRLGVRYRMEYGVAVLQFGWAFGVVIHDLPQSPSREWADADFLHAEDSREDLES